MSQKIIVGYDGGASSKRALAFAVKEAKQHGGSVVLAHVLEWSPYAFLTATELEERHKRRNEELERANSALVEPVKASYADQGVTIEAEVRYGHIVKTLCTIAEEHKSEQIVIGRRGDSGMSAMLFGSVAGSLAQVSPVAVTIVP